MKLVSLRTLILGWGVLASACTETDLCRFPCAPEDVPPLDNAVTMTGRACTLDPTSVVYPYKVLFVIDVSGSNQNSDPSDNRARAVQEVITAYIENRSVSFAAITFNTEPEAQTPGFTRNYEVLVPDVVQSMRVKDQGTNYLATLDLVYELLEEDILSVSEGERARTRYDVQWLSDGIPDPCQRPGPVREKTARVMQLRDKYGLFDLVINTTQLTYPNARYDVDFCNDVLPGPDYLAPMAEVGTGVFRQMDSGSLEFTIGFTEILRAWEQRNFFVVNRSRTVWNDELKADTDRDGVRDDDAMNEPDPTTPDSNGDGCSDRVEEEMLPNVGLCAQTCRTSTAASALEDTDGDEIPDCAEKVLGYYRTRIDSDLDGFVDSVELRFRTNPLDSNAYEEDADGDGVSDGAEIRAGTNPRWPESASARAMLAYRYAPLSPAPSPATGVSCFDFRVDNVRLAQTAATENQAAGENELCVHVVQTTLDDPDNQPEVLVACQRAWFGRQGTIDYTIPGTGIVRFEPGDFHALGAMHGGP